MQDKQGLALEEEAFQPLHYPRKLLEIQMCFSVSSKQFKMRRVQYFLYGLFPGETVISFGKIR